MREWLNETRQKPKPVRDQYAFLGATIVTGLIAIVWVTALPEQFAQLTDGQTEAASETTQSNSAFAKFFADTKEQFASVLSSISSDPAASTEAVSSPDSAAAPVDSLLELAPDTVSTAQEKQEQNRRPPARAVLIATSSPAVGSTTDSTP